MHRLRARAEELDLRQADRMFLTRFIQSCKSVNWDVGVATKERIEARLTQLDDFEREREEMG